ncbi:MAG: hypothetical protein CSA45_01060 [Gammaproteobacteria bacterium]|nr:MAG: hypothetical protein CSA45_01060 [Gammaproteobacteria bacterium]
MNITETLGLKLPVFQAPLECYPNQSALVAKVSECGALGIYSANYQSLQAVARQLKDIKQRSQNAFAVMVDVSQGDDSIDLADRSLVNHYLHKAYRELGISASESESFPTPAEVIKLVIDACPAAIIFQNGLPDNRLIKDCQHAGIMTMAMVSNTIEAIVADKYVDVLILQGMESAGVQSRFNNDLDVEHYPINTLLHHGIANLSKPLVAWGDFQATQHVVSALINGAAAVLVDTLFWTTKESPIPTAYRQALRHHNEMQTTLSSAWLGYPARTLKNELTRLVKDKSAILSPKKQQRIMLPIIEAAIEQDNADYLPMWAGFYAVHTVKTVSEVCEKYIAELNEIIT